jgi:hypothetical protein
MPSKGLPGGFWDCRLFCRGRQSSAKQSTIQNSTREAPVGHIVFRKLLITKLSFAISFGCSCLTSSSKISTMMSIAVRPMDSAAFSKAHTHESTVDGLLLLPQVVAQPCKANSPKDKPNAIYLWCCLHTNVNQYINSRRFVVEAASFARLG